ncbi:hypothetical protein QOZ88_17375 [Blastococcus sp. BMG 814]|uniref:Uncharacterized protein n=1 Tax=Blastococcus carthaginiensis TaxID=3050034 RepID=A0ABT9IFN9_9ACTN|nr:hypothetical protein [Blastococcus carthaginiensis]MDP5184409.1 hypothetical protein [Blastococcus carthaginiensis]
MSTAPEHLDDLTPGADRDAAGAGTEVANRLSGVTLNKKTALAEPTGEPTEG